MKLNVVTRIASGGLHLLGYVFKTDLCFIVKRGRTLYAVFVLQSMKGVYFPFGSGFQFLAKIEEPGRRAKGYSNGDSLRTKEYKGSLILFHPTDNETQTVLGKNLVQDAVEDLEGYEMRHEGF